MHTQSITKRKNLLAEIGSDSYPRVSWQDAPVLIEVWEKMGQKQIHLVNYGIKPQKVNVYLGSNESGTITSFGHKNQKVISGSRVGFALDFYSILIVDT